LRLAQLVAQLADHLKLKRGVFLQPSFESGHWNPVCRDSGHSFDRVGVMPPSAAAQMRVAATHST
jgi:hypothetical protein